MAMANRPELQGKRKGDRVYRKGIMRSIREARREEAIDRDKRTAPDKRRSYWRELGFTRQSEAARIVKGAVAEGTVISRTIVPDVA
jgi:hypothetical protein